MVGCFIRPPMVLLRHNRRSSTPSPLLSLDWRFDISCSAPYCISVGAPPPGQLSPSRMGAPQSLPQPRSGAPLFHSRFFTSLPFRDAHHRWVAPLDRRSLACICAPQFHSALLHHHHHSHCPPCAPHQALLLSWWHTSFPCEFIILPFNHQFDSPRANFSIPTV